MEYVFFIYGLAFFSLGVLTLAYPKKGSGFPLAGHLWLVAAFGIMHGANEWLDMWGLTHGAPPWAFYPVAKIFLLAGSFACLYFFGLGGIAGDRVSRGHLLFSFALLAALWLAAVLTNHDAAHADILSRYLIGVPGTLLAAAALFKHAMRIKDPSLERPSRYLRVSAMGFAVYGVLAGLIVPKAAFPPASILNYEAFNALFGFPVQVVRSALAVLIAVSMVKVLDIFTIETQERLKMSCERLDEEVGLRTAELTLAKETLEREVAERIQAEASISRALKEKDILLQEVHHRVKNNMAIISALLNLQIRGVEDKRTAALLRDSQSRIRTMAMVHDRLYRSEDLAHVDFREYVQSLAEDLLVSYSPDRDVRLTVLIEPVHLSIDALIPCGLIINELVTNSLKHGLQDTANPEIRITFMSEEDGRVLLTVSDNGRGLPGDAEIPGGRSVGFRLVHSLVKQIGGELTVGRQGGAEFLIRFSPSAERDARPASS